MTTQIDILLKVQDCDLRMLKLRREIQDIPARESQISAGSGKQKQNLDAAKESLKQIQARASELELEIQSHKQRILKFREQQLQLKTNKEFKAMEEEVKGVEQKISEVEDRELQLFEETDRARTVVQAAEEDLKRVEAEFQVELDAMKVRQKEIEAEVSRIAAERAAIAAEADSQWLTQYQRMFENKNDAVLVSVEGGSCGGCHMKLPPHIYHRARVHDTMIFCSFCGRLLY